MRFLCTVAGAFEPRVAVAVERAPPPPAGGETAAWLPPPPAAAGAVVLRALNAAPVPSVLPVVLAPAGGETAAVDEPVPRPLVVGLVHDPKNTRAVTAPLPANLPAGRYLVRWRALSPDGHRTQGDFGFTIAP